MDREFEKFRGRPNEAFANRWHVTIQEKGVIILNKNVFNQMGKPEAVFLHYSRARDMIAIEPASPTFNESFPVKTQGKGLNQATMRINASPFCQHFNIQPEGVLKFIDPDIRDGRLYLSFHDTISVSRGKRKKK